ncbi:glycosyltransferase family 2 protein [Alkalicoccobacillus porphyridii]|uniref:Glucosyl-3-phosphoglycerate synthase n=1 Tax=Alkalicoccobacillus porphyridii TaxID=2597270 RepID=A0A553ZV90_9BACI|nr:glycosyltransferase family 2 protein [Alkalicoccobacillus porphyridii]TSB45377.1 glycosyltransferase family 2 protein [Alkalicoccobacillus porphyridii]
MTRVSVIIPAYNEEQRLAATIESVRTIPFSHEIICVNDGSSDQTAKIAEELADTCVHLPVNRGKGQALQMGWKLAKGMYILCLDADLTHTAAEATVLLEPLMEKRADLTISKIVSKGNGGRGIVKQRAQKIIHKQTGIWLEAPLSGQRAFQRRWLRLLLSRPYDGFGIETIMCLHMIQGGARLLEIETSMEHREMGKSVSGILHRLRQWRQIEKQWRRESI